MNGLVWAAVWCAAAVVLWPARAVPTIAAVARRRRDENRWRRSDPEAECLEVLDTLITVLRAGSAVSPALAEVLAGPASREGVTASGWCRLRQAAMRDEDVVAVWRDLAVQWRRSAFDDVAAAWTISARRGCPLADALESAASSVRARRAHRAQVDAASAGARASTGVLMGLPVLGMGLGTLLGVDMMAHYRGAAGLVTLWPGLALMVAGSAWVRRMTAGALRPPSTGTSRRVGLRRSRDASGGVR